MQASTEALVHHRDVVAHKLHDGIGPRYRSKEELRQRHAELTDKLDSIIGQTAITQAIDLLTAHKPHEI